MERLQYDSFYKFIVSVGVLLIVAPVFCYTFGCLVYMIRQLHSRI